MYIHIAFIDIIGGFGCRKCNCNGSCELLLLLASRIRGSEFAGLAVVGIGLAVEAEPTVGEAEHQVVDAQPQQVEEVGVAVQAPVVGAVVVAPWWGGSLTRRVCLQYIG